MQDDLPRHEGLRARKRRETFQRIADVGLELFLANGYAATTLDDVALAAGISRRTFFHYFKSKDEILLAHMSGYVLSLRELAVTHSATGAPFDVAQEALKAFTGGSEPSRAIAIARVMGESDVLRTQTPISYLQFEQGLYEGLCQVWPDKGRHDGLRLIAMVSVGAMRLAVDKWLQNEGEQSLAKLTLDALDAIRKEIGGLAG